MKTIDIIINEECNYKCHFCLLKITDGKLDYSKFSLSHFDSTLKKWRDLWYKNLCISWWEPTISKNLFKVLALAKYYWYIHIEIVTNGTMLSDDFCKKLKKYWVNRLLISMTWYNSTIFENQVWVLWTFDNFLINLKNSVNYFNISINIVVNNINIKFLNEQAELLKNIWIKNINLLHAIPYKKNDETLPTRDEIQIYINNFLLKYSNIFNINIEFFPFCLIKDNKYIVLESNEDNDIESQDIAWNRRETTYKYKIKTKKCNDCKYLNDCNWFWRL